MLVFPVCPLSDQACQLWRVNLLWNFQWVPFSFQVARSQQVVAHLSRPLLHISLKKFCEQPWLCQWKEFPTEVYHFGNFLYLTVIEIILLGKKSEKIGILMHLARKHVYFTGPSCPARVDKFSPLLIISRIQPLASTSFGRKNSVRRTENVKLVQFFQFLKKWPGKKKSYNLYLRLNRRFLILWASLVLRHYTRDKYF